MIDTSRLIYLHGSNSGKARQTVQKLLTNVRYYVMEDEHPLQKAVHELDWNSILA